MVVPDDDRIAILNLSHSPPPINCLGVGGFQINLPATKNFLFDDYSEQSRNVFNLFSKEQTLNPIWN